MFQTFDRIKELAKKQGLSINLLEEKLGYSRNTIYNLKNSKPVQLNEFQKSPTTSMCPPTICLVVQITQQ